MYCKKENFVGFQIYINHDLKIINNFGTVCQVKCKITEHTKKSTESVVLPQFEICTICTKESDVKFG